MGKNRPLRLGGEEQPAEEVRIAYRKGGNRGVQKWRLAYLKQTARKQYVSPLEFAFAYARLGQNDEVFHWLEKAHDDHVPKLVRIQQDSDLNSLHSDPRFQAFVKRIGLHHHSEEEIEQRANLLGRSVWMSSLWPFSERMIRFRLRLRLT